MSKWLPRFVCSLGAIVLLAEIAAAQDPSPSEAASPLPEPTPEVAMMKAVRVHAFGGPDALQFEDAPRPEPGEDEILIRVMAAGVNPVDASLRAGRFARMLGTKLPLIPGLDVAGVIESAGAKVTKFKPGDAVYACLNIRRAGGYA